MSFERRENLHELMDEPGLDVEEHRAALRFLGWMNRWTLARWMLGRGVRGCLRDGGAMRLGQGAASDGSAGAGSGPAGRPVRVLDVATGGGDIPQYFLDRGIAGWAVGVDRSAGALRLAREMAPGVIYVQADALRLPFADGVFDAATCHLFCHHLTPDECGVLFREMDRVARLWVVMDLERSRWLYCFLRVATLFSRSRLAKWDGPVSVRRSYRRGEIGGVLGGTAREGGRFSGIPGRWTFRI